MSLADLARKIERDFLLYEKKPGKFKMAFKAKMKYGSRVKGEYDPEANEDDDDL